VTVHLVPRAEWGAQPWRPRMAMYRKTPREQLAVFTHYHGGPPRHDRGAAMAREIESIHLANGWAGVGYTAMIGLDGVAFEGRGWDLVTAACPGWNRQAWHFYVAVGGEQVPTPAALHTLRQLYDEACHRSGRTLAKTWHGAHYATDCPGDPLRAWVRAGMNDPRSAAPAVSTPNGDDDMPTPREVADALLDTPVPTGELGSDGHPLTFRWAFIRTMQAAQRAEAAAEAAQADVDNLRRQLLGDGKVS